MTTQSWNTVDAGSLNAMAPPGYGEHLFDQLYHDVDPSGFQTPLGMMSQSATPLGPLSRSTSVVDLTSTDGDDPSDVITNTLRNRLDNLNTSEDSRTIRDHTQAVSSSRMSYGSGTLQQELESDTAGRRTSGQSLSPRTSEQGDALPSGAQTPMQPSMSHFEHAADDLTRVPSYSTALQARLNVPIDTTLPNYQTAMRTSGSLPPVPRPPSQAPG